ncbi:MAG: hypothetical protein ACXV8O_13555 [Methylobacter sp.]
MHIIIKKIWNSDITELTDRLKRIKSSQRSNAKYFVFKCEYILSKNIANDIRAKNEILDRAQGKSVYLLRYDILSNGYILEIITKNGIDTVNDELFLEEIRSYDLREVVERTNGDCFIEAPKNIHFVTPSGKHTTRFLRLTDAIYSYNALDRISFWLQPYLAQSSAVIIDTWSLSSIILRTQQLLGLDIPFDCFHEHIKCNETLALSTLNKLSRRVIDSKPILFLVGISSSGEFFKALPNLIDRSNVDNKFNILSIYGFNNIPNNVDVLSRLNVDMVWFDKDNCQYCKNDERKTTYQIDSKYYYPRKYEEVSVRFSKYLLMDEDKITQSNASVFIHKYGKHEGVLVAHKDDPNDGISPRHHAFYIDVSVLMSNTEFVEELTSIAKNIEIKSGVPEIVILPPHAAADSIAKHLKTMWNDAVFIFDHNLKNFSEQNLLLKQSQHICFVDDVSISGSRIETYLRVLREEIGGDNLNRLKQVSWFPLILRTESNADIDRIKDSLSEHGSHWKNDLFFVYKVILPDWSGDGECPWCNEEAVFDKHIGPLWDEPEWYKERRSLLRNTGRGIKNNPLFVPPFTTPKTLGAGSALGDEGLGEIQVIFLIANGLQILRTQKESPLGKDELLVRYVLSWENNTQDTRSGTFMRFSEPFIQSCFLRTVKLDEWSRNVWMTGKNFLKNKLESGNSNELIGEAILFYLKRGTGDKLDKSTIDKIGTIYNDDAIQLLLSALEPGRPE